MSKYIKYFFLSIVILAFVAELIFLSFKNDILEAPLPPETKYEAYQEEEVKEVTEVVPPVEEDAPAPAEEEDAPIPVPTRTSLPPEVNLKVPFTSQAPHQNWDQPYKEFCEESSVLMVQSYLENQPIVNADDADAKMLAIRDFEIKRFGYHEDTTAEETAIILKEFYNVDKVAIVKNPTIVDVKTALADGKALILPLAGRKIGNPYYHQPGPLFHMLVVKGYTKKGDLITNDPGTRRGADFIYKADVLLNALSDWNHLTNDIAPEKKVMIVAG